MRLVDLVIGGLVYGSIYALITSGLVLIYRSSRVLNFSHGSLASVAGFVALSAATTAHVALPVALLIAVGVGVGGALLVEATIAWPLREARPMTIVVATLGAALTIDGAVQLIWGHTVRLMPPLVPGVAFSAADFNVTWQKLIIVGATIAAVGGVSLVVKTTSLGIALRAASENPVTAALLGTNLRVVSLVSWAIGGLLTGLAAFLIAPEVSMTPTTFTTLMIQSFVVIVLAGFTSIMGAVVGGFVTGISLNLWLGYGVSNMPNVFLFALLLVALLARPNGLFGQSETTRL